MRSKLALLSILTLAAFAVAAPQAQAGCPLKGGECSHCSKGGDSECSKGDCGGEGGCPIMAAFKKKSHFFLENAQEIGLSDEQVTAIKAMKTQVKKWEIQQMAGMQIGMMDMEEKLHANPVDVEGLNAMIDQGMADMGKGAKELVATYAKLKAVLTPEQMTKAKAIWKKSEK